MEAEDVVEEQVCSLSGRGEFSKGDEMGQLTKPIHKGEDDSVALGRGKTGHEVQRDVRPGTMGNGQGVQEAGRGAAGGLTLVTHGACVDKAPDILLQ